MGHMYMLWCVVWQGVDGPFKTTCMRQPLIMLVCGTGFDGQRCIPYGIDHGEFDGDHGEFNGVWY